jgi:plasmid stability protein
MAAVRELHVRQVPDDLYEALRARAKAEGRSMSAQAVVLLRQALGDDDLTARRRIAIERLKELSFPTPPGFPLAQDLIREDRDSR